MTKNIPVVCSYNEWDPLREVIVGSVLRAAKPAYEPAVSAYFPLNSQHRNFKGEPYSEDEIYKAESQLDNLAKILRTLGITVRRPDQIDYTQAAKTPDFQIPNGNCNACPRDVFLIVGDEIIEVPMAQRSRFFEYRAYRSLIKDYFRLGARWTSAPKPMLADELYISNYSVEQKAFHPDTHPALTELEPCFDAASFVRLGRDIFYQIDLVTNYFGAQWLQRHLGTEFRLHQVKPKDDCPQHIDATLVPLRPGLVLLNPDRPFIDNTLELFKQNKWEIVYAPHPVGNKAYHSPEVSKWISMNLLSLDEKRVIVEEQEEPLIRFLESLGFEVITCPFREVYKFGGGFHCCTLDIRREGKLESYFPSLDV